MITIYNRDISQETIESLNGLLSKDISPEVAFKLLGVSDTISDIIVHKNKIHNKILLKYGIRDENDKNRFNIPQENLSLFETDLQKLNNIKHNIEFEKISIQDLQLEEKIKIQDLQNLRFLFNFTKLKVETEGMEDFEDYDSDSTS